MSKVKEDKTRVILEVDGKQAINQLGKLEMEANDLKNEFKSLKEEQKKWTEESKNLKTLEVRMAKIIDRQKELQKAGKESSREYAKLDSSLEQVVEQLHLARKAAENLKKTEESLAAANVKLDASTASIKKLRDQLGLSGMTMRQLINHSRDLRKELYNGAIAGTDKWTQLKDKLSEVTHEIDKQRRSLKEGEGEGGFFGGISGEMKDIAASAGIFMGAGALFQGLTRLVGASSEFEASMSNLSAITGATGEQLDVLEKAARRIGSSTTISAQDTARAFTIIASKKPELLENNDALIATTESAILLAEAAGIELPVAADALTNSLNQFGVGADQANRFVNVLAAGSKFGAGEIDYLNDAVSRFGPIAGQMNLSFEQSVAMMEIFAEKGLQSEKAGTQFRNILVKLAAGADETNPAIVGMDKAIENLGKQQMNTAELAKQFGVENLVAAQIMVQSGERFKEFTANVTGTSAAVEQARTRLANFKGETKLLMNVTGDYAIVLGGLITDALMPLIKGFTAFLLGLKEVPKFIEENKAILITFTTALLSFNTAQIISTGLMIKDIVWKKAQIVWTTAAAVAQRGLNTAMTSNPIGLILKSVVLLVSGFALLYNSSEKVRGAVAGISEVAVTMWTIIKEIFGQISSGFSKLFDGDISGGLKDLGKAFIKSNPVGLAIIEGKRLAGAFAKGYKNKLAEENLAKETLVNPDMATSGTTTTPGETPEEKDAREEDQKAADDKYKKALEKLKGFQNEISALEEKQRLSRMDRDSKEIAEIEVQYGERLAELRGFHDKKEITDEQYFEMEKILLDLQNAERDAVINSHNEAIKKNKSLLIEEVTEMQLEGIDKELASEIKKFDEKIALYKQYGLDVVELEKAKQAAIDQITGEHSTKQLVNVVGQYDKLIDAARSAGIRTKKYEEAKAEAVMKIQQGFSVEYVTENLNRLQKSLEDEIKISNAKESIQRDLVSMIGSTIDIIGKKQGELTDFQKLLTVAQIAIDSGAALAKIIPLAADASKGTGPAAPFIFAGYVAAMGATVLGAVAKAKNALSQSNVPEYNSGGGEEKANTGRSRPPKPKKSFYFGGFTGNEDTGEGDKYGNFAGWVHQNEYVMPESVVQEPFIANLLPAIEAIRQDRVNGFSGGSTAAAGMGSDPETKALLKQILSGIDRFPKEIRGKWVRSELQDIDDEEDYLKKKYRV